MYRPIVIGALPFNILFGAVPAFIVGTSRSSQMMLSEGHPMADRSRTLPWGAEVLESQI